MDHFYYAKHTHSFVNSAPLVAKCNGINELNFKIEIKYKKKEAL